MQKFTLVLMMAIGLSGCAIGDSLMDNNHIKRQFSLMVKHKCTSQLQSNDYWKLISRSMSQDMQSRVSDGVCGCVSDAALENISFSDIQTAVINEQKRPKIIATVIGKTLKSCVSNHLINQ